VHTKKITIIITIWIILPLVLNSQSYVQKDSPDLTPNAMTVAEKWKVNLGGDIDSSPAFADVDSDGLFEIIIGSSDNHIYCINSTGGVVWSAPTAGQITTKPAIADLDGDGFSEIIVGSWNMKLHCFNHTGDLEWSYTTTWNIMNSPSIADLDNDGTFEIIASDSGGIYCINHRGQLEWIEYLGGQGSSTTAIGDLDKDGTLEVVFLHGISKQLRCLDHNGATEWTSDQQYGSNYVILADIDGDTNLDIIFGNEHSEIRVCNNGGYLSWIFTANGPISTSPVVADFEGDGNLEIIFGTTGNTLYFVNSSGHKLKSYSTSGSIESSPAIADLDGDEMLDIVFGCDDFNLRCISSDVSNKWSFSTNGQINSSPTIIDLDRDGVLEIIFGSVDHFVYCLELNNVGNSGTAPWNSLAGSAFSTGQMDTDSDLIDDLTEKFYSTDVSDSDSDNDNLLDGEEILMYNTNPLDNDSDGDSLTDYTEIINLSDPNNPDTDGDGLRDDEEVRLGEDGYLTNPNDPDTDGDGVTDYQEMIDGTDPTDETSYLRNLFLPSNWPSWVLPTIIGSSVALIVILSVIISVVVARKRKKPVEEVEEPSPYVDDLRQVRAEDTPEIEFAELSSSELAVEKGKLELTHSYLNDLLNTKAIMIISKDGIPIVSLNVGLDLDSNLAGGFLTAITGFGDEILPKKQRSENRFVQMGQEGSFFWIFEGKYVRLALLFTSPPQKTFKKFIWDALKEFEDTYQVALSDFSGNVSQFEPAQMLLERTLGIHYLYPMKIDSHMLTTIDPVENKLKIVIESYLENFSEDAMVDIHQLIEKSFRELKNITNDELLSQIIVFVTDGILVPIPPEINSE